MPDDAVTRILRRDSRFARAAYDFVRESLRQAVQREEAERKLAAEREAQRVEQERLAAERREFERQQAEFKRQQAELEAQQEAARLAKEAEERAEQERVAAEAERVRQAEIEKAAEEVTVVERMPDGEADRLMAAFGAR